MKVVIAGGSGSLGRRVADDLAQRDYEVVILTRPAHPDIAHRQVKWDGRTVGAWASELEGAVLINLAGELVEAQRSARRRSNVPVVDAVADSRALRRAAATANRFSSTGTTGTTPASPPDQHVHPLTISGRRTVPTPVPRGPVIAPEVSTACDAKRHGGVT